MTATILVGRRRRGGERCSKHITERKRWGMRSTNGPNEWGAGNEWGVRCGFDGEASDTTSERRWPADGLLQAGKYNKQTARRRSGSHENMRLEGCAR